jgi:hypothetical protein
MTIVRKHYDPPVPFEKFTPAIAGKGNNNMTDNIDRGPFYKMLDRQALARQSQTGESYAVPFTKIYEDPSNRSIVDRAQLDHLAKAHDAIHGTRLSPIPVQKAEAYDPLRKAAEVAEHLGPAHAKLHSLAVDHQRAHAGMSYQSAYAYLYAKPENAALRNAVKSEHMRSTMAGVQGDGVGKAAPPDPPQDDVSPGSAHDELNDLVMTRMKNEPKLSYQQAFTREYLHENNRSLKSRVDAESVIHAQRLAPTKPFPAYTAPGHRDAPSNLGRSGTKPRDYVGG